MSKYLTGPFVARSLGRGAWVLTTDSVGGPDVLLFGAGAGVAPLAAEPIDAVRLAWVGEGVEVALTCGSRLRELRADAAIVHEPNDRLYQSLPLAGFDAEARRFWRRVFRLIRIPGGRLLLGWLARRGRARRTTPAS